MSTACVFGRERKRERERERERATACVFGRERERDTFIVVMSTGSSMCLVEGGVNRILIGHNLTNN